MIFVPALAADFRRNAGVAPVVKTRFDGYRAYRVSLLAYALDDEGATGRVGEPHRQDFLVFRRIVPALHRFRVGEFEDDDPFRVRSAFDQFSGATAGQEAAAILRKRGVDRRAIGREPCLVCDLVFGDELGRHVRFPC